VSSRYGLAQPTMRPVTLLSYFFSALALQGASLETVTESADKQPEILFYFPPPRYQFQPGMGKISSPHPLTTTDT
jgi:hypothetical protein